MRIGTTSRGQQLRVVGDRRADEDPLDVASFATHHLPLDEASTAYELFQNKADGAFKVVIRP